MDQKEKEGGVSSRPDMKDTYWLIPNDRDSQKSRSVFFFFFSSRIDGGEEIGMERGWRG